MIQAPSGATGRRAAFTLLELLTVITLIAVLAGLVLGVGRRAVETGKIARAKAELAALSAALEDYHRIYGDFPRTDDEACLLQSLLGKRGPVADAEISGRPLLEAARFTLARPAAPDAPADPFSDTSTVLLDPWSRPYVYVYRIPASGWTNPGFVLYSAGPDGKDSATLLPGGLVDTTPRENADNIYANFD
jgi:general secretion pathway protein G